MAAVDKEAPAGARSAPMDASGRRYGAVSITLHWIIAVLVLVQLGLGWTMNHFVPDHSPVQDQIETLHISIGLTILLLVLARIGVRLTHPAPPLPAEIAAWERLLARFTHVLFYVLILALPLTGWALVSVRPHPIEFWGIGWPRMPGLGFLAGPAHKPGRESLQAIHTTYLVWIAVANLLLHVAGALRHQFDGRPVLWRMLPFGGPRPPRRA